MKILGPVVIFLLIFLFGCSLKDDAVKEQCYPDIDFETIYQEYERNKEPIAAVDFSKKLSPESVQKDLLVLRKALEESNTSLYRYSTKPQIDHLFDEKICLAKEGMDYLSFVRHVAEIFNAISCGHSGWAHSSAYKIYRNEVMKFFPLKLHAIQDQYFVKNNASDVEKIKEYDEILEINGRTPSEINTLLKMFILKDGLSGLNGRSQIGQYFHMAYSNFIDNPDTFNLKLKSHTNESAYSVDLPAKKLSQIDSIIGLKYSQPEGLEKPLQFEIDVEKSLGIYTIKSFRNEFMTKYGQDFKSFTDSIFDIINKEEIKNLIIDIRFNGGGWTANGAHLFSYFIDHPTDYIKRVEFNKIDSFSFNPLIISGSGVIDTMKFNKNDSLLEWVNYPSLKATPQLNNKFLGNTYILINDMSWSASVVFSSLMKEHTNAKFIGEETGGAQCGQNGMVMAMRLPYTGLTTHISTAKYSCNVSDLKNFYGVKPDFVITNSINSIKEGKDEQMNFTVSLLNQ